MSEMKNEKLNYGMGEAADRTLADLENLLREHEAGLMGALLQQLNLDQIVETMEICDEDLARFEQASLGASPFQKLVTGITYTVNALQQWREEGALGTGLKL